MKMVEQCYKITNEFTKQELDCLTNQIRRAAISVPSNIAEGKSRWFTKEILRFLSIVKGSLSELETQLILEKRLDYIFEYKENEIIELTDEIGKMIGGLRKSLLKKNIRFSNHYPLFSENFMVKK